MSRFAFTRPWIPVVLFVLVVSLLPSFAQDNAAHPVQDQFNALDAPITLQVEMLEPVTGVVYNGDLMTFRITIQNMSTSISYPTAEVRFYFNRTLYEFFYAWDDGHWSQEPKDLQFVFWRTSDGTGDPAFGPGQQWDYTVTLRAKHTIAATNANLFATLQVFDSQGNSSGLLQEYVYFDLALRPTPTPVAPKLIVTPVYYSREGRSRVGDHVDVTVSIFNDDTVTLSKVTMTINYPSAKLATTDMDPVPGDQAPGWLHWRDLTVEFGDIAPRTYVMAEAEFEVLAGCPLSAEISIEVMAEANYGGSHTGRTYWTGSHTLLCEAVPEQGDLQAEATVPTEMPVGVRRYYAVRVNNTGSAMSYNTGVIIFTDGLVFDGMVGPGEQISESSFRLELGTIPPGGSRAGAILFEIPADAPVGKVFHTWAGYSASDVTQEFVATDITVIAPPPTRTPTPTPLPTNSGDIACQLVDPADGEMANGEQMTIRLRATNTGANVIQALSVLLDWDAACLDYVSSQVIPPNPDAPPGDGSWLWEHWGVPYLQPGANLSMNITLKAKDACGLTTLGASFSNPATQRGSLLDRCSSNVTIVKPGGAAVASLALAQKTPMAAATPQAPTAAATEAAYTQLLANRTFEMTPTQSGAPLFWETAGILAPRTVTETAHSGSQSLLIGLPGAPEVAGDGWAWQWVTIPADTQSAVLHFYSRLVSTDADPAFDRLEAGVLDPDAMRIAQALTLSGMHDWSPHSVDLTHYAGKTVAVAFHVWQDGNAGRTWAFVDDVSLRVEPPAIPRPAPSETGTEGVCWPQEAIDYALAGMPDFDQVREGGKSDPTGAWTHDASAAAADVLWWLDSINDPGDLPPPTIADSYGLVTSYDPAYDDHSAYSVPDLIADLAARFETGAAGTRPGTVVTALRKYIADKGLAGQFTVTLHRDPTKDFLMAAAAEGDGVILLMGFWEWQGTTFARIGGHYAAMAGYSCNGEDSRLALSDPWRDAAENGSAGFVSPWYRHVHSGSPGHTPHDNAVVTSHDVYPIGGVGGVASLAGYSVRLGDLNNFAGLNFALEQGEPVSYRGGLVFNRLDYAIVIAPAGTAAAQSAAASDAILHGTVARQGWPAANPPDFPMLVTLWHPFEAFPTYAWTVNAYGGAEFTTPPVDPDIFTVRVKGEGTLANVRLFEELSAGTNHLDFSTLLAGDLHNDDRVDALDVSALAGAIAGGSTDSRFDLNSDGALNGGDIALVRTNFGNSGDTLVGMGEPPSQQVDSSALAMADADSSAYLALLPSATAAHIGYNFTLAVMAYAPEGPLDTVEVHLQFDPALLQVVDAAGSPALNIMPSGALPTIVQNKVDNTAGRIDFAATTLAPAGFQGSFPIAHICFKPLAVSQGTWIRFLSERWPATQAVWRGRPILRRFVGAEVKISDEPLKRVFLPAVLR